MKSNNCGIKGECSSVFTITYYVVVARTENRSANTVSIESGDAPCIHVPVPESWHSIVTKGLYGFEEHSKMASKCVYFEVSGSKTEVESKKYGVRTTHPEREGPPINSCLGHHLLLSTRPPSSKVYKQIPMDFRETFRTPTIAWVMDVVSKPCTVSHETRPVFQLIGWKRLQFYLLRPQHVLLAPPSSLILQFRRCA